MKEHTYWRVLIWVTVVCILCTLAHFAYAVYAYEHSSIIQFIAKELW